MTNSIQDQVRTFVLKTFLFDDVNRLPADDASFIDNDIVDSTGILELVSFVEEHFGIVVDDSEIVPANFDSIVRVAAFVSGRNGQPALGSESISA